jgi:hypothetical protein
MKYLTYTTTKQYEYPFLTVQLPQELKYGYRVNYQVIYNYLDYHASVVTSIPWLSILLGSLQGKNPDYHGLVVIDNRVTSN